MNKRDTVNENNINKASIERAFETSVRFKYSHFYIRNASEKNQYSFWSQQCFLNGFSKQNTNKEQSCNFFREIFSQTF